MLETYTGHRTYTGQLKDIVRDIKTDRHGHPPIGVSSCPAVWEDRECNMNFLKLIQGDGLLLRR